MQNLTIQPLPPLSGEVRLPGSKSLSNRALLLAALARGTTRIDNLLRSDDTQVMLDALETLGIDLDLGDAADATTVRIKGAGGPLVTSNQTFDLHLGLAGTALRPLTAALTLGSGTFTLDGTERMRERPIAHLVDGLTQLGANISYLGSQGYPPLKVCGTGLTGGTANIPGHVSSQFLTSLLMAAPLAAAPITITVEGEQVSKPYLDITLALMARFSVTASHENYQRFHVEPAPYISPGRLLVEGDASAASYFLAAGAISAGSS